MRANARGFSASAAVPSFTHVGSKPPSARQATTWRASFSSSSTTRTLSATHSPRPEGRAGALRAP